MSPSPVPADSAAGVSTPPLTPAGAGPGLPVQPKPAHVPATPGRPATAVPATAEQPATAAPATVEQPAIAETPAVAPPTGEQPAAAAPAAAPATAVPERPARRRIDVFSVAALFFGILPLVPFALAAGLTGLARTAEGRRAGRPAAIAGLVLAGAWAVAGAVAAAMVFVPGPAPRPQLPQDTVFTLRTGQCADTAANGVSGAHAVSCSQPHEVEVYATYQLAGQGWPGTGAVSQRARQGCLGRLGSYLDPELIGSTLTASYAYPDQVSWAAGERTVVCEIRSTSGLLTRSVRGLGQSAG